MVIVYFWLFFSRYFLLDFFTSLSDAKCVVLFINTYKSILYEAFCVL